MAQGFYTLKGYMLLESDGFTAAMQDYLEMICRLLKTGDEVRINQLAHQLHVRASSASKMAAHLREGGYITFEKYGLIKTTPKGDEAGRYLLYRHEVINSFLCLLNHSESELEQVEKIEHFLNYETVKNMENLIRKLKNKA